MIGIGQSYAKAVPARLVGEFVVVPPVVYAVSILESLLLTPVHLILQFGNSSVTLTTIDQTSVVFIHTGDIEKTLILTDLPSGIKIFPTTSISTASTSSIATSTGIYLSTVLATLYLSSLLTNVTPNTITLLSGAETWVLNMENSASSQYDDFGFNSFSHDTVNQRYLACSEDGIYSLSGTTDNGVPIDSLIEFGTSNFGSQQLKNISNAWLGLSTTGQVYLKVQADNNTVTYEAKAYNSNLENQRVDIGKGLRGAYWKFSIISHTPLELESITFLPLPINRRIK